MPRGILLTSYLRILGKGCELHVTLPAWRMTFASTLQLVWWSHLPLFLSKEKRFTLSLTLFFLLQSFHIVFLLLIVYIKPFGVQCIYIVSCISSRKKWQRESKFHGFKEKQVCGSSQIMLYLMDIPYFCCFCHKFNALVLYLLKLPFLQIIMVFLYDLSLISKLGL